jgi:hypothetical protein
MRRILLILSAILFCPLTGFTDDDGETGRDVPVTGFIDIIVESNVNSLFFSYSLSDRSLYENDSSIPGKEDTDIVNIIVPVRDFRCTNKIAFKDFLTLLKADQYPNLAIAIPQNVLMQFRNEDSLTLHNITISIAGISRKYDINCIVENPDSEDNILVGTIKVQLNDLKIKPPVKYFGLVKIKEEVIVKFGFSIKDYSLAINKNSY